jgi:hypothetical protein
MVELLRFLLLLITTSYKKFFAQLVREAIVWIAWFQETVGTQMACHSTKMQSTDDISLPFKTKATARAILAKSLLSVSSSEKESSLSGKDVKRSCSFILLSFFSESLNA